MPTHIALGRHRPARMLSTNAKPRVNFAGLHRFATCRGFISSRNRDACRSVITGFRVALSEVSPIDLTSFSGFTPRLDLPAGIKAARLAPRPLSPAPVPRPGITLKQSVEGGRRRFASGTPATRGAHNSETLRQQPDQPLVRESIPTRVTVAVSVDAFPGAPSRRIGH